MSGEAGSRGVSMEGVGKRTIASLRELVGCLSPAVKFSI